VKSKKRSEKKDFLYFEAEQDGNCAMPESDDNSLASELTGTPTEKAVVMLMERLSALEDAVSELSRRVEEDARREHMLRRIEQALSLDRLMDVKLRVRADVTRMVTLDDCVMALKQAATKAAADGIEVHSGAVGTVGAGVTDHQYYARIQLVDRFRSGDWLEVLHAIKREVRAVGIDAFLAAPVAAAGTRLEDFCSKVVRWASS
jgi:hypothetical protein